MRLYGVNAVQAMFAKRPQALRKLYLAEDMIPRLQPVLKWCVANRVGYRVVGDGDLNKLAATTHHEGLVADVQKQEPLPLATWLASLQDKFTDHGLTALLVLRPLNEGIVLLDSLAISCRVLGRGFEHWLLAQLAARLMAKGVDQLVISLVPTDRNQPARDFLATLPTRPITTPAGLTPLVDEMFLCLDLPSLSLPFLEFYANE